jgi:MraZ protein
MLLGSAECTVDSKGRVSIPAKYLENLDGNRQFVLTRFFFESDRYSEPYRCLDVYPMAEWERFIREFRTKPRFDPDVINFENFYISEAHSTTVDGHGRIFIPTNLRVYAGLKKTVKFTAALEKLRVWDKEFWDSYSLEAETRLRKDRQIFSSLKL